MLRTELRGTRCYVVWGANLKGPLFFLGLETAIACAFNPEQQRVSFTAGAEPLTGARVRFECLQTAPPQTVDVSWPCTSDALCDPDPDNCLEGEAVTTAGCEADPANCCETRFLKERYDRDNLELVCDTETNTCQLTCESNVQCPGGFACFDENEDGTSYCVNPTCSLNQRAKGPSPGVGFDS